MKKIKKNKWSVDNFFLLLLLLLVNHYKTREYIIINQVGQKKNSTQTSQRNISYKLQKIKQKEEREINFTEISSVI